MSYPGMLSTANGVHCAAPAGEPDELWMPFNPLIWRPLVALVHLQMTRYGSKFGG